MPAESVSLSMESSGESSLRATTSATTSLPAVPWKLNTSRSPGLSIRPFTTIGSLTFCAVCGLSLPD